MSECTRCPEKTERCAHLGDDWVRLEAEDARTHLVLWSWPVECAELGFGYDDNRAAADAYFDRCETEMRKEARRE